MLACLDAHALVQCITRCPMRDHGGGSSQNAMTHGPQLRLLMTTAVNVFLSASIPISPSASVEF